MERRTALAVSAAVGATLLASGAAFAANVGLLNESDDPVGRLEPTSVGRQLLDEDSSGTPTTPQTIIIDVPVGATDAPGVSGDTFDDSSDDSLDDDDAFDDSSDASLDDDDAFDDSSDDSLDDDSSDDSLDDDSSDDGSDDVEDDGSSGPGSGHDDDD